ncbi:MAG: HDOD domain-containing protein, partial [Gammaproteobacteria bacterium]|nr:HDOD domain-containing protein [Gammaproteobacteria bacterium]
MPAAHALHATKKPEELVLANERLFALPEAYIRLQEKMQEPNVSINELARLVSQDADITARLLRLVNGPVFGFQGRVDTVSRAIALIGMRELEMLLLATVAAESFKGINIDVANMATFWQHSVFCAVSAQILAKRAGVLNPERLFVAGLLHDIGSLVIWKEMSGVAAELLAQANIGSQRLYELERAHLGYDHGEVGAALLKLWNLPVGIQMIAAHHHAPQRAEHFLLDAAIVHVADLLAASREL